MSNYTSSALEVLEGLDPVKKRPNMYTDTSRPNHLAQEAIDNGVDEALAGFARRLEIKIYRDGSVSVEDNGRGMPVDIHPTHGIPGVQLILTKLHAGAKFSNKTYQFSGGLHGVGISVTNALSSKLVVEVKRQGKKYRITFADGLLDEPLHEIDKVAVRDTGTKIHFYPDEQYFENPAFHIPELSRLLRAKAILCAGLEVSFIDEIHDKTYEWFYPDGIQAYVAEVLQQQDVYPNPPYVGKVEEELFSMDWLVGWSMDAAHVLRDSYVNLIPTPQGGTHVNGLRSGLLDAVREFCDLHQMCPKGVKLKAEDIWESCLFVLSVKFPEPHFAGQTKERLVNQSITSKVQSLVRDQFSLWLHQHMTDAQILVEAFIAQAQKRMQTGQKTQRKKWVAGPRLPGKLVDCLSSSMADSELFLVEGDSAGGSAKQARDKNHQAILPLRGKILNTWELDGSKILQSKEVQDISIAIGVDPGAADLTGLRYGKICILTDADSDGSHISTLLCALFLRHFPALVEKGHVYVALPPLFRVDHNKHVYYAQDVAEKDQIVRQIHQKHPQAKLIITRFKGLGEMNVTQLRETTMSSQTRRLMQLTSAVSDGIDTATMMDILLAKKQVAARRSWLNEKGDLADI